VGRGIAGLFRNESIAAQPYTTADRYLAEMKAVIGTATKRRILYHFLLKCFICLNLRDTHGLPNPVAGFSLNVELFACNEPDRTC